MFRYLKKVKTQKIHTKNNLYLQSHQNFVYQDTKNT